MLSFGVTNIANVGREIYVWYRIDKTLSCFKDSTFRPYFYQISPNGIYKTIDGKKVEKIICSRPSDVKNRRDEGSYEADILFTKRYIIDKITNFNKIDLHWSFIDIEVLCKELPNYLNPSQPISCISCSNSYTGEIKTFFLLDYYDSVKSDVPLAENKDWIEIAEEELLNDFVKWTKEQQFDLVLGWNFIEFDWLYLCARYKKIFSCELAEMLSPIAQSKYLGSSQKVEPTLIPAGLSVCDYFDMYKKIYRTEPSYALDIIAQKRLNEQSFKKVDFSRLIPEIKEKNINDVKRMIDIEKKLKIIEYYDELRRMSMCEWSDVTWNSKMIDMILLREAKQKGIILPSKHYGEGLEVDEIGFEGAYRRCDTGLYKGLYKLDLSSAYPMAIINFCLDISNIKNEGITINKVKFYQNDNALLPTIARKMISKKDVLKSQLKSINPESEEGKDLQIKYDAIKAVVNSLFGVCGLKIFRLFDYRVAASITFLIRDLLHYVEDKLIEKGMKVIYIDTDSFFIDAKENPKDLCNELVKQWAKEKYNKDKIGIEFDLEGKFDKIFIIALCHYKGYLNTPRGVKEEIKGIEARRKDSSNFIREFQTNLIEKIMNEKPQEEIIKWINLEKERIKTLPLQDIGFPARLTKQDGEYKTIVTNAKGTTYNRKLPIHIQAKNNSKKIFGKFDKQLGDNYWWIYYVD
jgi:DNA polymerase elongation subunit (family B)